MPDPIRASACQRGLHGTTEFDRWWHSPGQWVEPANQRRGGESGVRLLRQRDPMRPPLYCKRQTGHIYRSLLHPFGCPTILREQQAYRALSCLGIMTPKIVYCAARQQHGRWQALLVTEALQGFVSLEQWYIGHNGATPGEAVLRQLAVTLARLHQARWQHGCCYPKHIFISTHSGEARRVEIALLDLEKSRRRWRIESASRHDLRQLERHRGEMPKSDLLFFHEIYRRAREDLTGI
ncbi:MAG: phosphotransferase [Candidatus Accumulibacter sp.]|jgi:hypothetical protein|nr:phosphotransferase [Accumulibacter sp.]